MAQKKAATLDLRTYLAKARGGTSKEYQKNRTVFSQGNPADAVFYIEKGKVKLTVLSARGKEAVVAILGNGDFFGEGCLAGQPLRIATAASITECSILRVQKETMIRMLHNEPAWSERFMAYLLSRNVRIEEDLVDQLFNSSEKRLARILLLLTRFGKDGQHLLTSWGPGRFDAVLDKDGKAFRPDGKQAGTLIPPAFGLASVNLSTWTGFGSVTYWNAYVAATQMHGPGTFFDARFNDREQYPVSAKSHSGDMRATRDRVTSKLAALHFYQLALPAPKPPAESFDKDAAARGLVLFNGTATCATCHVPPLFTEPGNNLHAPSEIGVDSFQADRSPTHMYRTAPLAGLWTHQKGGFYHDGRFATLRDVLEHYNAFFKLELSEREKTELTEYLKSL